MFLKFLLMTPTPEAVAVVCSIDALVIVFRLCQQK